MSHENHSLSSPRSRSPRKGTSGPKNGLPKSLRRRSEFLSVMASAVSHNEDSTIQSLELPTCDRAQKQATATHLRDFTKGARTGVLKIAFGSSRV